TITERLIPTARENGRTHLGLNAPHVTEAAHPNGKCPLPELKSTANLIRYGSREAELVDWGIFDQAGHSIKLIPSGSRCRISLTLRCKRDIPDLSCGFAIKDRKGTVVWGATNLTSFQTPYAARAGELLRISCECSMWLAAGDFFVTLGAAHLADGAKIDFVED